MAMSERPGAGDPAGPVMGISWDRTYPRCVWCRGENYVLAMLAYSAGEIPCAAVYGCGRFLPEEYRRVKGVESDDDDE